MCIVSVVRRLVTPVDEDTNSEYAFTQFVFLVSFWVYPAQVVAGSVSDSDGNLNAFDSNTVAVTYFAGQCSNELGCQWQLAMYQHELALDRLKEESHLETQRAVEVQRVVEKVSTLVSELLPSISAWKPASLVGTVLCGGCR